MNDSANQAPRPLPPAPPAKRLKRSVSLTAAIFAFALAAPFSGAIFLLLNADEEWRLDFSIGQRFGLTGFTFLVAFASAFVVLYAFFRALLAIANRGQRSPSRTRDVSLK